MRVNFDTLYSNYPSSDPSHPNYLSQRDLFTEIGWESFIGNPNYHNTAAIRVSIAFVKSGINIVPSSHRIQKGPYAGKGIEVNMRRLATLMKRTSYLGEPDPYTPATARNGIGARNGVVAFNNIPGYTGGGHIDLVRGGSEATQAASAAYYNSETIWFWPLQASRGS
uniref:TaeMX n=1 Tax=Agrobacterium fabrum (strain C58 / ATCC 33970) TaxID=176299 RepID=A0A7S9FTT9_AGRFC|nr:TaeMX [Agrobacterium fabrum str. C58]